MGLTTHQGEILNMSLNILSKKDRLLITGNAGVGKTFMVDELIKRLSTNLKGKKIYCSAPTNKAVAVLKGKVTAGDNIEFVTTHQGLKIKRSINYKTGDISFKPFFNEKYPPLKNVALFIIDEVSMLPTEMVEYVETHAKKNNTKVIFIGDKKQLNPVGEKESPVFLGKPRKYETLREAEMAMSITPGLVGPEKVEDAYYTYDPYPEVELTQIVRQGKGNPIIDLSRNTLQIYKRTDNRIGDEGYIHTRSLANVVSTLANVNGTDALKYLTWTNKDADSINNKVRKLLYNNSPAKVELGETLVFNDPYKEDYYASKEVKVEKLDVKVKKFFYPTTMGKSPFKDDVTYKPIEFKIYCINGRVDPKTGKDDDNIVIIHEDSEGKFKTLLKNLGHMARSRVINWADMYSFKEQFAETKYNHALTIHKSQGSTYSQSIVNIQNIGLNSNRAEAQKLLYTGITRTSKLLILYKA